jgi:hypothetical protein
MNMRGIHQKECRKSLGCALSIHKKECRKSLGCALYIRCALSIENTVLCFFRMVRHLVWQKLHRVKSEKKAVFSDTAVGQKTAEFKWM